MIYLALLRGINVGGNNRVEMSRLKDLFSRLGFDDVKTYINSGNVIFYESKIPKSKLTAMIERAIETEFGFKIHVVIRNQQNISALIKAMPPSWKNNQDMKCDVMFLWSKIDNPGVVNQLGVKPDIEDVKYVDGAIIWRLDRHNVGKSGMLKLVGTPIYKQMTIRNCNTVRKLDSIMQDIKAN